MPAHLQVQQSSHSAPSMGMPAYYNPYMGMPGPGMVPVGMMPSNLGPPNPSEAAAAHGFSSPPQFRPPPGDATRAHSLGPPQNSPLSPTSMFCVTQQNSIQCGWWHANYECRQLTDLGCPRKAAMCCVTFAPGFWDCACTKIA